ncbi:LysR substrate-binding domain-containing protein [Burkholderia pyrrocinia]|uniref:LysR substrate-binding domain-containing protein n=1 Tax=Burkholderia pyrrocinia TaxID=60550 RepID=UPI002AB26BBF|nr:LysR substrate-binding domain-containing protein [Burkholderia pyrrocinia]
MDTRQLKYFVQVIESGSFSKASRQLFIVQPALSQQVARLEEEIGKPLLIRSVRGVVPTENGAALYHHAKFVLRQLDEALLIARQEHATVRGHVTLGLAPSTSCVLGLPLLRQLKRNYPGIMLNVVAGLPGMMEEQARQSQLDLAILFSKTAASELVYEPLLEEEVFVVVRTDSRLVPADRKSLTLAEVAALPLVLSSAHHSIRRRMMLEFERAGLEANVMAEIDSLQLVMRYVMEEGGATIQPMAATLAVSVSDGWRCLGISDVPMDRPNYLYSMPIEKLSAGALIVHSELKQTVARLVESGAWKGVRLAAEIPVTPVSRINDGLRK